jgi:predicted small secreted protein
MRLLTTRLLTVLLLCGLAAACNTIAGMGDDVSAAGNAVSKGAEKVKGAL